MSEQITSLIDIKREARNAVEAGIPPSECPYEHGSRNAKRWLGAYWQRELELERKAKEPRVISTFAGGAVEQLEVVKEGKSCAFS